MERRLATRRPVQQATITYRQSGRSPRARTVFADGEPLVTTSAAVIKTLGLEEGDSARTDVLLEQISRVEPGIAFERAIKILDYRERSTAELRTRLLDDGYSVGVVDSAVERLAELGLVSDERFAELFARTKHAAGWGNRRIASALRQAGICDDLVAQVLAGDPEDAEYARALAFAARKHPTSIAEQKRVSDALVRKGFSFETARRAAREVAEAANGGD